MAEHEDDAFGGKGSGFENIGNTEGAPQIERKGQFGYHRAFIQHGHGKFEWFFVKRGKDGSWKRVHKTSYAGLGEIRRVSDGIRPRLAARVFVKRKDGRNDAKAIYLPEIKLVSEESSADTVRD